MLFTNYTYLPETGEVFNPKGRGVGAVNKGRCRIAYKGKYYPRSWVAVYLMTGKWPEEQVDHVNRNPLDDRWNNLRACSQKENARNKGRYSSNKSGYKGVYTSQYKDSVYYHAKIQVDGRPVFLGSFPSAEEAHAAYCEAAIKYHKEFHSIK